MTPSDIKRRLALCRPWVADDHDAAAEEALRDCTADPGLQSWHAREQAFDSAVRHALVSIQCPADLLEKLKGGLPAPVPDQGMARNPAPSPPGSGVSSPLSATGRLGTWWRTTLWSAAAGLLIVFTLSLFLLNRSQAVAESPNLDAFATLAGLEADQGMGSSGPSEVAALVHQLREQQAPVPCRRGLPPPLSELAGLGCRPVVWDGRTVSLICLQGEHAFHLFTANRSDFPHLPSLEHPKRLQAAGRPAVAWSTSSRFYLLVVVDGTEQDVPEFW